MRVTVWITNAAEGPCHRDLALCPQPTDQWQSFKEVEPGEGLGTWHLKEDCEMITLGFGSQHP